MTYEPVKGASRNFDALAVAAALSVELVSTSSLDFGATQSPAVRLTTNELVGSFVARFILEVPLMFQSRWLPEPLRRGLHAVAFVLVYRRRSFPGA